MKRINVTSTFLPPIEEYQAYLEKIWESGQLTNQGPLLLQLESELKQFLNVQDMHIVCNGTAALQLALSALDINEGEVITTPFSYVATTSAILWERCKPVFVDIEPDTFCIDPSKIEAAITENTKAILAVHVFGNPCDIDAIEKIAQKHNLRVIYDAAHAFGVEYKGKSLLSYGDVSMCSFHATKIFHTVEGGCLIVNDTDVSERAELIKRFGHDGDEHFLLGINAKQSEMHAAMGLCNIKHVSEIIAARKRCHDLYSSLLEGSVQTPTPKEHTKPNYSYYPIVLKDEKSLLRTMSALKAENIHPRRYFYPSLNELPYIDADQPCPVSEDISRRIMCLPVYVGLEEASIKKIAEIVKDCNG